MKKGFTLVELVIVIVIVGILSVIAVPVYRGYIYKARLTEGKALANALLTAQRIYYVEHGQYHNAGNVSNSKYDEALGIDARGNTYYDAFISGQDSAGAIRNAAINSSNGDHVGIYWSPTPKVVSIYGGTKTTPFYYISQDGKLSLSNL